MAAHRERSLVIPTLLSIAEAAAACISKGITVELIITLDQSDPYTDSCIRAHDFSAFSNVQLLAVTFGDLGKSRNEAIHKANSAFIATADADDLVSESYFFHMYSLAVALSDERFVIYPSFLMTFGEDNHIEHFAEPNPATPLRLLTQHLYTSRLLAPTKLLRQVPYAPAGLNKGAYAYEDWHLTSELFSRKIPFYIAPNTILFYRVRKNSQMQLAQTTSIRDAAPQSLTTPLVYLSHCLHVPLAALLHAASTRADLYTLTKSESRYIRRATEMAHAIEPLISPTMYNYTHANSNLARGSLEVGIAHLHLCYTLGSRAFQTLIFLDAESREALLTLTSYFTAYANNPEHLSGILIILLDSSLESFFVEPCYDIISIYPLNLFYSSLSCDNQQLLLMRLIQAYGPTATLFFSKSHSAQTFLERFYAALDNNTIRRDSDWDSIYRR